MNDQELLQLAAKAIGCESSIHSIPSEGVFLHRADWPVDTNGERPLIQWNPLVNSGAAMKLALKLGIQVWRDGDILWVGHRSFCFTDIEVDTRRAIVEVAAQMGKEIA